MTNPDPTHFRTHVFPSLQGGYVNVKLRYHTLPELILEQTQATVIHRVNERTLSPVNLNVESG